VTSLYPSGMTGYEKIPNTETKGLEVKYPTGKSRWSNDPKTEFYNGVIGIYEISYSPCKDIRLPIAPRRDKSGVLWSLEDGKGVYCSVDIENMIKSNYKITEFHKGLVYDSSGKVFNQYINFFYKMKEMSERDKNDVMRSIAKLFLNSLYGKTLQKAMLDKTLITSDVFEYNDFCTKYDIKDIRCLNDNKLLISGSIKSDDVEMAIKKPLQLGSFVLGYSRLIMANIFREIDPTLRSPLLSYSDTDSLHITGEGYKILMKKGYYFKQKGFKNGISVF
jgi:hypothetical protein